MMGFPAPRCSQCNCENPKIVSLGVVVVHYCNDCYEKLTKE